MQDFKTEADFNAWLEEESHKEYREKVVRKLRLELSIRRNNDHVGSGMGGNASQFLFIISHGLHHEKSPDDQVHFIDEEGDIVVQLPQEVAMKSVRLALNDFFENHPKKNNFTEEQIRNPSFLRDVYQDSNLNVTLLIKALEIGYDFVSWLDKKGALFDTVEEMKGKEILALQVHCLKDMGFSPERVESIKEKGVKTSKLRSLVNKHPVWGARIKAVTARYEKIWENLVSQEDWDKFGTMGAFPDFITMFSVRNCVQIDRMVKYNLDEHPAAQFLLTINKDIEESLNPKK